MRVLRSLWIWGASGVLIMVWTALIGVIRLFDRDPARRRTAAWFRRLGRILGKINPWRLHISGREHLDPAQTYVIVSNHQSLADIPLIAHLRVDTKWLAKAELFGVPFVGWMMRMAGGIPVERTNTRHAAKAMLRCAQDLRQRASVVFFPEGTRSRTGELLPFNDGPFRLAIREKVPILPLVVEGSGDALPRNTWLFGPAQDIYLQVLPAISVDGYDARETGNVRDLVHETMAQVLRRLRQTRSS